MRSVAVLFALISPLLSTHDAQTGRQTAANTPQATIEMTGSTNTAPMKLAVTSAGAAQVHVREAGGIRNNIEAQISSRLFEDIQAAGSLNALPRTHCVKSVSFGTALYLEFNGERSPDLSCPAAPDSKTAILKKDVQEIMQASHANPRVGPHVSLRQQLPE